MITVHHMGLTGALLIFIGSFIRWQIGRRRFNRRTITGLEWFTSYTRAIITKSVEWTFVVFAKLLILAGVLLILVASV